MTWEQLHLVTPPDLVGEEAHFKVMRLRLRPVIDSWRASIGSVGWFHADGRLKAKDELDGTRSHRVEQVLDAAKRGDPLPRPVCGIGVFDCVEIGIGTEVVVACALSGAESVEAFVPNTMAGEFKSFTA